MVVRSKAAYGYAGLRTQGAPHVVRPARRVSPRLGAMKDAFWVGPLTLFVMAGTFFSAGGQDGLTARQWGSVMIAGLACLALLLWRLSAEVTVLVVGVLVGLYLALGHSDGPVFLPFFVASFLGARALPVRRWLPAVGAAVAALLVGMAIR